MHVFLDLDGTLTDPERGITRSIAHALAKLGLAPPVHYIGGSDVLPPPLPHDDPCPRVSMNSCA